MMHEIKDEEDNSKVYELNFINESSGTQILFSIAPLLKDVFENGKVLVIDEIERSLHPNLVEMIVKFFHNSEINKGNAQLIFNTHNPSNTYLGYNSLKTNSTGTNAWWLMTPAYAKTNGVRGHIISPSTSVSELVTDTVNLTYAVRPVISIKETAMYKSGDGSAASPYEILTN